MKIGVFDSGYGGLSVFKHLEAQLPDYDYVYLGDNARAPYGPRTIQEVRQYTAEAIDFFVAKGCKLIILACNTASAMALRWIQQQYLPQKYPDIKVLGVLIPAVEEAALISNNQSIGVMATAGTVNAGSFYEEIIKLLPEASVKQIACPTLVPLIEAGDFRSDILTKAIKEYLEPLVDAHVDTIILGCTHYELIESVVERYIPESISLVSVGQVIAVRLTAYLQHHLEIDEKLSHQGHRSYFTTGSTADFSVHGEIFLGHALQVEQVVLSGQNTPEYKAV